MTRTALVACITFWTTWAATIVSAQDAAQGTPASLQAMFEEAAGTIVVSRIGEDKPILTQHARADFRPYMDSLSAPNGDTLLPAAGTDPGPAAGLFWGFTKLNGRDFFHHPQGDYWRRVSAKVIKPASTVAGDSVQWQTVYDQLDQGGNPILRESQIWSMQERDGAYLLDLQWSGEALTDVTVGRDDLGGLFLRLPLQEGKESQIANIVNTARQTGQKADGKQAVWIDIELPNTGGEESSHIALFDHPANPGFPLHWSVDPKVGAGAALSHEGDWTIHKGERALVEHRLVAYVGTFNDVEMSERWSQFSGTRDVALWHVARLEGREAEFLTPEKAVAAMTVKDGFEVNVFASEPMITQPMAFCWDDRGRMWVAENRDYETRKSGFSGSGDSRILILEDTDHDGVADSRKVFLEGIPFPSGIAIGFDGLWLGAPPNLLFVPDRNHDDQADLDDIEVRRTGWGIRDRHETINSFHWGPDGWLYGTQGIATPSQIGKPSGKGRLYKHEDPYPDDIAFDGEPVDFNGGVWRYHPTKDRFEVVAHGFSNPWGIDYDAKGQLFITACVIPHLWHVVQGGLYFRQGGSHFNPYAYSDIDTIADHRHRSAHGGARIYLSDAFPEEYQNRIFMANLHEHAVLTDILERKGSGFVGRHGDDFLLANNAQWIGFSVEIGPEGAVYVLDWHDGDICGMDVLNKETGRVFRIASKTPPENWKGRYDDLQEMSDADLVDLQRSKSAWHARRARLILQTRAAQEALGADTSRALRDIYMDRSNADHRLRAMWALHLTGGLTESDLLTALDDKDEYVRSWAIQLLCEDLQPSSSACEQFAVMAEEEESPVVRLYLAAALQRMPHEPRWSILRGLVSHAEDANDHNIPHMIWYGLEPLVPEHPNRALHIATRSQIPLISRHIARRLTDAEQLQAVVAAIGRSSSTGRMELLLGLRDGLEGRYDVKAPSNWADVSKQIEADGGDFSQIGLQLSQQFGDTLAAKQMLETLRDEQANVEARRQALQGLSGQRHPALRPQLLTLLNDDALRRDTIRAMAAYDDILLARALLREYSNLSADDKLEAIHTLASRTGSGMELTQAIKRGDVPRRDVPAYVVRLLRRVVGNSFVDVWGPIDAFSADQEAAFAKYRGLLSPASVSQADPSSGRAVFKRTCAACHRMYGEGGMIGPEITGANRASLDYLLGNILTPSAEIQDAYRMQIVLTDDGRVYSGIPAEENERQLKLRVANQTEPVVISRSQIESRQIAPVSMMPQGILDTLTDDEVRNLIAYLQTQQQVPIRE